MDGIKQIVVPKAAQASDGLFMGLATNLWSGNVLECPKCGVIYRFTLNFLVRV